MSQSPSARREERRREERHREERHREERHREERRRDERRREERRQAGGESCASRREERHREERREERRQVGGESCASRREELRRRLSLEGGARDPAAFKAAGSAWRDAVKEAHAKLQPSAKAAGRPLDEKSGKYSVPRDMLMAEASKTFADKNFRSAHGLSPERSPRAQSPSERTQRVHGVSRRELHKPVTRSEAVELFLKGYREQSNEGRVINPQGDRKYTSGPKKGQAIPTRTVAVNAQSGLRRRLRSRSSPDVRARLESQGRIVKVCPDGTNTMKQARENNCEDSWKLRRQGAWRHLQADEVTVHPNKRAAKASALWAASDSLVDNRPRKPLSPERRAKLVQHAKEVLSGSPKRSTGESKDAYRARVSEWRSARAARLGRPQLAQRPGQSNDEYRRRRASEMRSPSRSSRSSSVSSSQSDLE